ncbi:unnamed protein product, partial [Schistosoma turkestanicum]
SKKKTKPKSRITQMRSCNKKICCRDMNGTEDSSKSRKQTPNKSESKRSYQKDHNHYGTLSRNHLNCFGSNEILSLKRSYTNSSSTFSNHTEQGSVLLE